MVGLNLKGRLGNQLFQLTFIFALAKERNTWFFINYPIDYPMLVSRYFSFSDGNLILLRIINRLVNVLIRVKLLNFEVKDIPLNIDSPELGYLPNNAIYSGFFQTPGYYLSGADELDNQFRIKKKYRIIFRRKYGDLFSNHTIITMHVRRTDYADWYLKDLDDSDFRLPIEYYSNCLKKIGKVENCKIIVIGDDIEFLEKHFGSEVNFFFEKNDEITDFQILLNSNVVISSNSSFAWWGCFLNRRTNRRILAPRYWLGFKAKQEYPVGIMVEDWEWVEF